MLNVSIESYMSIDWRACSFVHTSQQQHHQPKSRIINGLMSREKKRTNYFNQNFHFSLNTNERLHNDNIGRCIAQYCYWILQKQKKKKEKAKCTRRFIHFDLCLPLSGSCTRKIPCHASICLYAMAMQRLIA